MKKSLSLYLLLSLLAPHAAKAANPARKPAPHYTYNRLKNALAKEKKSQKITVTQPGKNIVHVKPSKENVKK